MRASLPSWLLTIALGLGPASLIPALAATLRFGGLDWVVRTGQGGPGPNLWEEANVWLDPAGGLHLKIRQRDGRWSCAEVTTTQRLGFGRYRFQVEGPIDRLDDHVVLGLFNYPTADVGPDATHEIDIEFARWGIAGNPIGNYTVWPVDKTLKPTSKTFGFSLPGVSSTHRFEWSPQRLQFRSFSGFQEADGIPLAEWLYEPVDAAKRIAQKPMPVHINLWLFQGRPPRDGREIEVVIRAFEFVALSQRPAAPSNLRLSAL